MPLFNFETEFKLGIPQIDEEHARLINMLNDMHDYLRSNEKEKATQIFRETMLAYVVEHFAHEEEFMKKIGYPQVDEHAQIHANFRRSMEAEIQKFDAMDEKAFRTAMTDTYTWIINHIGNTDRKYVGFNQQK